MSDDFEVDSHPDNHFRKDSQANPRFGGNAESSEDPSFVRKTSPKRPPKNRNLEDIDISSEEDQNPYTHFDDGGTVKTKIKDKNSKRDNDKKHKKHKKDKKEKKERKHKHKKKKGESEDTSRIESNDATARDIQPYSIYLLKDLY